VENFTDITVSNINDCLCSKVYKITKKKNGGRKRVSKMQE